MMTVVPDRQALRDALTAESGRFAALLRSAPSLDRPVPGLTWTTGQLAAHVTVVYLGFAATLRGQFPADSLDEIVEPGRTLPETIATVNEFNLSLVSFPDPATAADSLTDAANDLLSAFDDQEDLREPRPAPWYGNQTVRTVGTLAAIAVSESLVHGYDLARAVGDRGRMSVSSAAAIAPTVMSQMLPLLLDTDRARGFTGTFDMRVRGGDRFMLRVADGTAWSERAGARPADCVLSMNPCAALLVGHRRRSLPWAIATGGAVSYGRKPWLGLRMPSLFLSS